MTNKLNGNVFSTSNAMKNEIIKQEDVQYGYDSAIANIATFFQSCIAQDAPCLDGDVPITDDKDNVIKKNVVIGGEVKPYIGGQGTTNFNIVISPLFAYNANTNQAVAKLEETTVSIPHTGNVEKYTVRIRASTKEDNVSLCNSASRAFNEPSVEDVTFNSVATKVQVELIAEVIPALQEQEDNNLYDEGKWIKLAEICIPNDTTDIKQENIKNITAHTKEERNGNWRSGIDRTYNPDYFTSQVARFLKKHDFTGDHREGVIKNRHLDKSPYGIDGTSANTLYIGGENQETNLQNLL